MSRYSGGWAPYVPVAERRRKAALAMEKLRTKGAAVSPVMIEGKKIAATFWGKAWCDNLESYRDYESRLGRGRTYVRNGSVVDLQIAPREVTALVSGSEIYKVKVSIGDLAKARWKVLCADCSGGIDSLVELLQGRFSKGVMERICRQDTGLFPRPSEIRFACGCLDHASMCKHVAAVLYGVGARLDQSPELLFRLRAVDATELLSDLETALPTMRTEPDAAKTLAGDDLAALFGLDMAESETLIALPPADLAAAAPRRKPGKRVVENPTVVAAPMSVTKARTAKSAPASTAPLARPARKMTTVAKTKSRSEPITVAAAKAGLDAPTRATASARRQTGTNPVIATPVAMSEHRPRRLVSSDTAKSGAHQSRGHGKS
jgi:uncharacterized Zn finger protein